MNSKSVFRLLLVLAGLMVIMQVQILSPACVAVQNPVGQKNTAQSLFSLLEQANATLVQTFQQLSVKHVPIPPTSEREYNFALSLTRESYNLLKRGNYTEASSKAVEALQKYKEALRIVYSVFQEPMTEAEKVAERTLYLKNALKRSWEYVDRLQNLNHLAADKGYNTTLLETDIESLRLLLGEASDSLAQDNLDGTLTKLGETAALVTRLSSYVSELTQNLQVQRLETYVVEAQTRLTALKQSVSASPVAATSATIKASLEALNTSQTSLNVARDYLNQGKIDASVDQLVVAKQSEQKAVELYKAAVAVSESTSSELVGSH